MAYTQYKARMYDLHFIITDQWDVSSIVALYTDAGWWKAEYDPQQVPGLIQASFRFCVGIFRKTGETVAMGRIISDGITTAIIQDMCVLKKYRGQGIGHQLLSVLIATAQKAGLSRIVLVAEPGTVPFYEKSQFIADKNKIFLLYEKGHKNEIV
jgi:GNAT superfamily N-acetyltransferase